MMSLSITLYLVSGVSLFLVGLHGLFARRHLIRRVIGLNIAGSGVFMIFASLAARGAAQGAAQGEGVLDLLAGGQAPPDPIPQAIMITGLVVAVSATAMALAITIRLYKETGRLSLDDAGAGPGEPSPSAASPSRLHKSVAHE